MNKNKYLKVLEVFFRNPRQEIYIRELARKTKVSPGFSKKVVDLLVHEDLLLKRKRGNLTLVKANLDSLVFKYMKIAFSLRVLFKTKFLDYLKENMELSSIVLFGSVARGEDSSESDIDLLVIGTGKISLTELESILKRKVSLIKYEQKEWLKKAKTDKAFYERIIIEGIPLYGNLPVVI